MITQPIHFHPKPKAALANPKKDFSTVDSHKLQYHPLRVAQALSADTWDKAKDVYPIYVEISPSGSCNARCLFCSVDYLGYKKNYLNTAILKDRLFEMSKLGVKAIMYAGEGEPMLHPDINKIVAATKAAHIDVAFTTNGTLMDREFVKNSLQHCSWIKISHNAGTAETYSKIHRVKEAEFYKTLENIRFAVWYKKEHNLKCDLGLQMVLVDDNAHEAETFVALAKKLGVDYAVLKPYSQHSSSITHKYEGTDYSKYMRLADTLETYNSDDFHVVFRANAMKREVHYDKCLSTPHLWAYIMATGEVSACSAYLGNPRFEMGNINTMTFSEIWQSQKRKELFEGGIDITHCRLNCRMSACNEYLDAVKNDTVANANFI